MYPASVFPKGGEKYTTICISLGTTEKWTAAIGNILKLIDLVPDLPTVHVGSVGVIVHMCLPQVLLYTGRLAKKIWARWDPPME